MEKRSLVFKSDLKVGDKEYKAGYAYELELEPHEFDRLTRQGCIYAGKDAKYYQETKQEELKPEVEKPKVKSKKKKKVEDNVDHKPDTEQAEIQTDHTIDE